MLLKMEGDLFKGGYYKAFIYLAGPCALCKECNRIKETPCNFPEKARPSMEGAGIDVYETARSHGFLLRTFLVFCNSRVPALKDSRSVRSSEAVWYRSFESLTIARRQIFSIASGTSGRRFRIGLGSSFSIE